MGIEPINMWPYLSQFVTLLTNFAHLEVFHDALSGYVKIDFCDIITLELYKSQS